MTTTMTRSHDEASRRVEKLSHASLRKIIDPDVDLLGEVSPSARNPLSVLRPVELFVVRQIIRRQGLLSVLVLGGEEIPDLLQKQAMEHGDTDPFIREVNRYHRSEEARHLAFARTVLPEQWRAAGAFERFLVRSVVAPLRWGM